MSPKSKEVLKDEYEMARDFARRFTQWGPMNKWAEELINSMVHPEKVVNNWPKHAFDSEGTPIPHPDEVL